MKRQDNRRGDEYGEVVETGATWIIVTLLACGIIYVLVV